MTKTILMLQLSLSRAHLKTKQASRLNFKVLHTRVNLLTNAILETSNGESSKLEKLKAYEKEMMMELSRITAREETEEEEFELLLANLEEIIRGLD